MLVKKNIAKAYLMPFMSVAGDHAKNDMASDEADSWKSVLTAAGVTCIPILKGTAEYDSFVDIWVSHIDGQLKIFDQSHLKVVNKGDQKDISAYVNITADTNTGPMGE
jgi:sirohydrochlorin cobaltochelatase